MAGPKITTEEAIRQIKALSDELKALKENVATTNKANAESFKKMEETIARLITVNKGLLEQIDILSNKLKANASATNQATKATNANTAANKKSAASSSAKANATKKATSAKNSQTSATNRATKATNTNTAANRAASGAMSVLNTSIRTLIASFGVVAGIQIFASIIRNTFKLIIRLDSLRFALDKITETSWELGQSQEFLNRLVEDFGVSLVNTAERWSKFLAAAKQSGLSLKDTENIFRSITKASAVLGLRTDELTSIYLALEQMLSKGKVTTEELRRQLGERLPGAMGIMAASMGVSIQKLDDMLRKGEVLSAEVLPDFAKAVEYAFGTQSVRRVDNLASSIGRMQGSWEAFVNSIATGEGPISKAFKGISDEISLVLKTLAYWMSDEEQRLAMDKQPWVRAWEENIRTQAEHRVAHKVGEVNRIERLEKELNENLVEMARTTSEERLIELKRRNDEITNEMIAHGKEVDEAQRDIAALGFENLAERLNNEKKLLEEYLEEQLKLEQRIEESRSFSFKNFFRGAEVSEDREYAPHKVKENIDNQRRLVAQLQAEYDVRRKLLQVSDPQVTDDSDKANKRKKDLREIRDLELEIQLGIVRAVMADQQKIIEAEESGYGRRQAMLEDYNKMRIREAELLHELELESIERAKNKELEILNREPSENEIPFTALEIANQTEKIEKEANQKRIIAQKELDRQLIEIASRTTKDLIRLREEFLAEEVNIVKHAYDERVILIKEEYNASRQTSRDKEKMDRKLADLAIEAANDTIDAQIKVLQWKLKNLALDQEVVEEIHRQIAALEALKQVKPPTDNNWLEYWTGILGIARDYANAIGDLIDALHERRIENINAEIEAERRKFDELIELAKDDDKQRETLERNKQKRIEELEKKRLKEEQKQAKARKAAAISEIAINTAVAIMRAWADTGPIGGPIFAAIIAALGAVQTAAVVAQPIPKYKDGGVIKKDEIAMINDGIFKEYVERNGDILTTDRKDAIVKLKKGDIVYKNYQDMIKNSDAVKIYTGKESISQSEFDRMFRGVKDSIVDGFKKAKLNNNINVSINNSDYYRDKMSRW